MSSLKLCTAPHQNPETPQNPKRPQIAGTPTVHCKDIPWSLGRRTPGSPVSTQHGLEWVHGFCYSMRGFHSGLGLDLGTWRMIRSSSSRIIDGLWGACLGLRSKPCVVLSPVTWVAHVRIVMLVLLTLSWNGSLTYCIATQQAECAVYYTSEYTYLPGEQGRRTNNHPCVHTCIHASMHTYIRPYIHTYVPTQHTYIHTDIQAGRQADRHAYIRTYYVRT